MSHHADALSRADREATDWLIRLQEPADETVYDAFEAWITASPANAEAWAEAGRVSHAIAAASAASRPAPRRPIDRRRSASRPVPARRRLVAAIASCAAVLVAVAAAPDALLRMRSDYVTGTDQLRTVSLSDGSVVTLAPRSAVKVEIDGDQRRVELLRGDAYFEVARDPARPFRVSSDRLETTVLGTGFEVRSGGANALVGVRHGRVRVDTRTAAAHRVLTAGHGVRSIDGAVLQSFTTDPGNVAAWTRKRLIVESRPVEEVVDALRPWYGGVILARGERLQDARVTGVYDLGDPVGALVALSRANGASVQRISPWVMVISFD